VRRALDRLLKAAGLPAIRVHDLRHTAASLMLELRTHPKVVSEGLGHSTATITLDRYSHALPTLQKQAASALDALIRPETTSFPTSSPASGT